MDLKRIMVGIDYSPASDLAVRTALHLARLRGAEVVLVRVCSEARWPGLFEGSALESEDELRDRRDERRQEDRQRFDDLYARVDAGGVVISQDFRQGKPSWGLLDASRDLHPDLIVVGSLGRGRFERMLLGSVAERVARHAAGPVLVVRDEGTPDRGYERVMIATDYSVPSMRALEIGPRVANPGATFDLVNCWRIPGTESWDVDPPVAPPDADPMSAAVYAQIEEAGKLWTAERADADAKVRFRLLNQRPERGLRKWVNARDVDLVVVGSHGVGADRAVALGSVAATTLRRAPCSVLVAR